MKRSVKNTLINSELLRVKRMQRGISGMAAAKALRVSRTMFNNKENGKVAFRDAEKLMLGKMLEMTVDEFNQVFYSGEIGGYSNTGQLISDPDAMAEAQ